MSDVRLIAVDWGTTSLRCYAVGRDGSIGARHVAQQGILSVADGDFAAVLRAALQQVNFPDQAPPVLMSGMIGSKQGWVEAPYVSCPAGLADLAAATITVDTELSSKVILVPGLCITAGEGTPDVIRGEEVQTYGALASRNVDHGLFVLPGTHSKWITVEAGKITAFKTYMTGEVFAALCDHTILGRLMSGNDHSDQHFAQGVAAARASGAPGGLLNQVFAARTLGLFEQIPGSGLASYLSGLLIGSELRAAVVDHNQPLYVMAGSTLAAHYVRAAQGIGLQALSIDSDSVVLGHLALAEAAGL